MHQSFLDIISCTSCGSSLALTVFDERGERVENGILSCACGNTYPVIDCIPRIYPAAPLDYGEFFRARGEDVRRAAGRDWATIEERSRQFAPGYRQVQTMFDVQWEKFASNEKIFGKDKQGILDYIENFLMYPGKKVDDYAHKLVLDAGCGHGYYSVNFAEKGARIVGLDITRAGVMATFERIGDFPDAHVVQGDVLNPPFKPGQFHYVVSEGVIHHTPNTRMAFHMLAQLVKADGELAVWVYPFRSKPWEWTQASLRAITTRLPARLLYYLCYIPVPLLSVFKAYSGTSLKNASWKECAQVVWDFYSPQYQTHHSKDEVRQWYLEEGFADIEFSRDPVGAVGTKR